MGGMASVDRSAMSKVCRSEVVKIGARLPSVPPVAGLKELRASRNSGTWRRQDQDQCGSDW